MDKLTEELCLILAELFFGGLGSGSGIFMVRPNLAVEVGAIIKQYRLEKKMTQRALAQKMHVDSATVSRHEHGANLSLDVLPEYADSLGVNVQSLIPQEKADKYVDEKRAKINLAVENFQNANCKCKLNTRTVKLFS